MEEGDSAAFPKFTRQSAVEWRNAVLEYARNTCNEIDLNGLLFLVTKDENQFRIYAENKPADEEYPEYKDRDYIPPSGDPLAENAAQGTIAVSEKKDKKREKFIVAKALLQRKIVDSLPRDLRERHSNEYAIMSKKIRRSRRSSMWSGDIANTR